MSAIVMSAVRRSPNEGTRHEADRSPSPHQEPRDGRRGGHVRPPRRRDPAGLRPADRLVDPPHPRAPRAGRRPHGVAATRTRPAAPVSRWSRAAPRATNIVTPLCDAYMDSMPIVVHHRPGRRTGDRHRRVPGGRHRRHHDAGHQAQLARSPTPRTSPASIREAFHVATTGRPGPVLVDFPKDIANATMEWYWPEKIDLPGYKPNVKGHPRQIKDAARLITEARQPVIYAGGGILQGGRVGAAARARRAHRHPGRHDADGPRRAARRAPALPRHAGHARQLHRGHRRCRSPTCSSRSVRASTTASPASPRRSRRTPRSSTSTSIRPSSARSGSRRADRR